MAFALRKISIEDAPYIQEYASDVRIAQYTASIPHPYPENGALDFIMSALKNWEDNVDYTFAITKDNQFCGVISLFEISWDAQRASIGYWVALPYWNQGIATFAVNDIIQFARKQNLKEITARAFDANMPSIRVLLKNKFYLTRTQIHKAVCDTVYLSHFKLKL